jgi:hypothetical protein
MERNVAGDAMRLPLPLFATSGRCPPEAIQQALKRVVAESNLRIVALSVMGLSGGFDARPRLLVGEHDLTSRQTDQQPFVCLDLLVHSLGAFQLIGVLEVLPNPRQPASQSVAQDRNVIGRKVEGPTARRP